MVPDTRISLVNSLAPGRFDWKFKLTIFMLILVIGSWDIFSEIALKGLTDDKSTLGQVMAWCRQATSHYLSQCWPRSMLPNGVTRPQWVNTTVEKHTWISCDIKKYDCFQSCYVRISFMLSSNFTPSFIPPVVYGVLAAYLRLHPQGATPNMETDGQAIYGQLAKYTPPTTFLAKSLP